MKRLTLLGLALLFATVLHAQVEDDWLNQMKDEQNDAFKEFEQFAQQAYQDYENFRKQANAEYAKFMAVAWKWFDVKAAEEPPVKPKPVAPMVDDTEPILTPVPVPNPDDPQSDAPQPDAPQPETKPTMEPIRIPDPISPPQLPKQESDQKIKRPQPIEPIEMSAIPMTAAQNVFLYGSAFAMHLEPEQPLKLADASEKSVAAMWKQLSDSRYDHIIAECLQQRDKRNLCDWAYVKFTQQVAEKQFGAGTNEAVVMQMYLLTQSGYKMRIGRDESDRLALLIGSEEQIFKYKYVKMDGTKFYFMDKSFNQRGLSIFDHAFPKEKSLSLALTQPDLQVNATEKRTVASKRYPNVSVTVQTNQNLIDFYNDYPISAKWNYYSMASLSNVMKEALYPTLRKAIEGKTKLEAANILLNFVQTGLEYKTDDQQFGYERPLYPDESFYYPYCDCEDRSILFSCLIRELLGLEIVLLDYPTHIATAIYFEEEVKGDYFEMDGKRYIISDPTYINAQVGMCAPKFQTISPKVVRF